MQSKKFSVVFTLLFILVGWVGYINTSFSASSFSPEVSSVSTQTKSLAKQPQTNELQTKQAQTNNSAGAVWRTVARVVDGDTVALVAEGGGVETVRLIGLDTPEVVDSKKPVQCFGLEASVEAEQLLVGQRVRLERDPTQGERDVFGRTLGYLFLQDGTNVAQHMIAEGFGREYTFKKAYLYQAGFRAAQARAQQLGKGLWAPGACAAQPR